MTENLCKKTIIKINTLMDQKKKILIYKMYKLVL